MMLLAGGAAGCAGSAGGGVKSTPRSEWRTSPNTWLRALPRDARVVDVAPGRFAGTYDFQVTRSASQSWASVSSRATVVLELAADGSATGCRGRRLHNIDGANDELTNGRNGTYVPRHEMRSVEQQGMRGRWRREGRGILIDLDLDAGVCPARAERGTPFAWHLRCAVIERADAATRVRGPVLTCGWRDSSGYLAIETSSFVTEGYETEEFLPGFWIVLAPGAGARMTARGLEEGLSPAMDVKWVPAATPIPFDDWTRSGP